MQTQLESAHMVTIEKAADRNMFNKYPVKVELPPPQGRNVSFIQAQTEVDQDIK